MVSFPSLSARRIALGIGQDNHKGDDGNERKARLDPRANSEVVLRMREYPVASDQ
jgi:hypothetical protein